MFAKLVTLTLLVIALCGAMLVLRQQRLTLASEAAVAHQRIMRTRQDLWRARVEAARAVQPPVLEAQVAESPIALEPATPVFGGPEAEFAKVDEQEHRP